MTSFSASSYPIGRFQGRCAATGRELSPGETFIAALVEPERGQELERRDYSMAAWEEMAGRPAGRGGGESTIFACWKAQVGEPGKPQKLLVDDEALVDLFEQLGGQTDPRRLAFRFVLALLLVRKRLLILDRAERGRLLVRFKGQARDAEPTIVEDPGLDEPALAEVESQLDVILAGRD